MAAEKNEQPTPRETKGTTQSHNKLVGPGLGLVIMGAAYVIWYIMPFSIVFLTTPPDLGRSFHNWVIAMTILIAGLAWYHKSVVSRIVLVVQAFIVPITMSGSVVTFDAAMVNWAIALVWLIVVLVERQRHQNFLEARLQKRTVNWLNMHLMIIAWILIVHVSFLFFVTRVPQEGNLLSYGPFAGFLANLPPEAGEYSTWAFDLCLIVLIAMFLYEQFKMGYNPQNKPWPRLSFWWIFVCMGTALIALAIQGH
jgi:hypothetical protein